MRTALWISGMAALGLLVFPGAGAGQTQGASQAGAAPLPVMLDIRDASVAPVPERIPKPFVPGAAKQKSSKPKKPKQPRNPAAPRSQAAAQAPRDVAPKSQVKPNAGLPPAPQQDPFAAPEGAPPLVVAPAEKISPIVPYVDETPQAANQTANQDDYKPASPDASPELAPAPAPAGAPQAAPAGRTGQAGQPGPEPAAASQPAPVNPQNQTTPQTSQ